MWSIFVKVKSKIMQQEETQKGKTKSAIQWSRSPKMPRVRKEQLLSILILIVLGGGIVLSLMTNNLLLDKVLLGSGIFAVLLLIKIANHSDDINKNVSNQ
jgi:hypothetical protein